MRQYVLIDLDDTLCAAWMRADLIEQGWDIFHSKSVSDKPIEEMITLVNAIHLAGFKAIGLTSRPNRFRSISIYWLIQHGVYMEHLMMRPDSDWRGAADVKLSLATEFFGGEDAVAENVAFVIDDREDVVKAFSGIGVTTLHVNAARRG